MRQTKKKKSGVILIVLVVAILAAIAGIALYLYNKNNAQEEEAAGHYIEQKVERSSIRILQKQKPVIRLLLENMMMKKLPGKF